MVGDWCHRGEMKSELVLTDLIASAVRILARFSRNGFMLAGSRNSRLSSSIHSSTHISSRSGRSS
jgi:hypothetical protein